jgi:16S rRNA (cytosine967-C5)-methyltransferase
MKKPNAPAQNRPRDARDFAITVIGDVVHRRLALDERLERLGGDDAFRALSSSDRGLARAIASAALRGLGIIRKEMRARLAEGLPPNAGPFEAVMIAAIAQILYLDVPDYAAVDTAIDKLRADPRSDRYVRLANAVLRAIARDREAILAVADPLADNTPEWLAGRWRSAYGEDAARAIAAAHLAEPPLDLSVKSDPEGWAARLGGVALPSGTVRLPPGGSVPDLAGFAEGAWWVQDVAAALPARLLHAQPGEAVLDLCAAPGGKTAQLAAGGAKVTAVDRSAARLKRLEQNLARLGLESTVHVSDALAFTAGPFPAILLDAPCSATGTIRRHPDVAWAKTLADVATLAALQQRLLDHAFGLLAPGGRLVYATCSLEREEGEAQIAGFLARTPAARLEPINPAEIGGMAEMITPEGFLRALPGHLAGQGGADGFFAARLVKA